MKRAKIASISCVGGLVLTAIGMIGVAVTAQEKERGKQEPTIERGVVVEPSTNRIITIAPGTGIGFPGQVGHVSIGQADGSAGAFFGWAQDGVQTAQFISAEMAFDNKVVKGAPFSGDWINESIQTLADGNRIINRSTTAIYRDSQGRTRREQEFKFFFGGGDTPRRSIQIFDPVLEHQYILDPQNRIARELQTRLSISTSSSTSSMPRIGGAAALNISAGVLQGTAIKKTQPVYPPIARAAKASGPVQVDVTIDENGNVVAAEASSGHPLLRAPAVEAARQWHFKPTEVGGKRSEERR